MNMKLMTIGDYETLENSTPEYTGKEITCSHCNKPFLLDENVVYATTFGGDLYIECPYCKESDIIRAED